MSYWDPEAVKKRIRRRYARRTIYFAVLAISLLYFAVTITDPNTAWAGIVSLIVPIVWTAGIAYEELSDRAIENELTKMEIKRKNDAQQSLHLTDDGEIAFESDDESEGFSLYK